ncbi:MAG: hypothetical protein IKK91_09910 [Ruminococcus sp.]|nr:hypothetical protein [Ruminococcus sp.]
MTKDEILEKSRQENKERDLYKLSVESNAGRIGIIVMYVVVAILTIVHFIVTKKFNRMLWIIALTVDLSMDIYKGVKLKDKGWLAVAVGLAAIDVMMTLRMLGDMYI